MALKSGNNLVGGAKRRLEDLKLARQASLPNETRCGHWLFAADARARAKACGTLPALAGLEKTLDNWEKVLESENPYDEEFPSPYTDLTPLQRLCAPPISRSTSPIWRVSCRGFIVACWSVCTPGRASASPQVSSVVPDGSTIEASVNESNDSLPKATTVVPASAAAAFAPAGSV